MNVAPTFLGYVGAVSGGAVSVRIADSIASGIAIIGGSAYKIGQVGSFIRIPQGYQDLYGIVCDVGANATPEALQVLGNHGEKWMTVQLVGESVGTSFERGISQYPSINDEVHLVTERDLRRIYGDGNKGQVPVGRLASAEGITVRVDLDRLITRHCAILGSTGSGKSTTVASLLRSLVAPSGEEDVGAFPSARILLLDIHGEYSRALGDVSKVFRINANAGESELCIPYWALDPEDLISILFGRFDDKQATHVFDKILELKRASIAEKALEGINADSLIVDMPVPFSLKRLWFELLDPEVRTLRGQQRDTPALLTPGDAETLLPPRYEPHGLGSAPPFINTVGVVGIRRQLEQLRSRMLDKRYDFLLHPAAWEPNLVGTTEKDLGEMLKGWLGHDRPITILDLSGVPSTLLIKLVGAILKVIYEAMFWSREKSEGAIRRPLFIVMEEAHRYLHQNSDGLASHMVQRVVKEGRKYGIGAMIVSQRPSEIDETILSQCGTFFALRMSNGPDRNHVQSALPDSLGSIMEMLPVLRTGEAIIAGEAARLPLRCRIFLPDERHRPASEDPPVTENWSLPRIPEDYDRVAASWRAQMPRLTRKRVPTRKVRDDATPEGS